MTIDIKSDEFKTHFVTTETKSFENKLSDNSNQIILKLTK